MRFARIDAQNQRAYRVHHEMTGRRLGTVRRLADGTWFALRASGPASGLVHSPGHPTRKAAAEALR